MHAYAKANFGVDCLEEQTEAEVAKVRTALAKVPMFTICFPKFKSTFNGYEVSYSNKYAAEMKIRQHKERIDTHGDTIMCSEFCAMQ